MSSVEHVHDCLVQLTWYRFSKPALRSKALVDPGLARGNVTVLISWTMTSAFAL